MSNASSKTANIMISTKVSVINSFYKSVQEWKYLMKSTSSECTGKGEVSKLCTGKFSVLSLFDEVRRENEHTKPIFLRKNVQKLLQ